MRYKIAYNLLNLPEKITLSNGNVIRYVYASDGRKLTAIYGRDGSFWGSTKEGFTGMVLIYSSSDKLSDLNKQKATDLINQSSFQTMDEVQLSDDKLSGKALSNIWTNIVKHFEGTNVFDEKFSLSTIKNQRIDYENPADNSANFSTNQYRSGAYGIVGTGNNVFSYENTVENLASTIIYHEWYGHSIKKYNGAWLLHHKAYQVVKESPFWEKQLLNIRIL